MKLWAGRAPTPAGSPSQPASHQRFGNREGKPAWGLAAPVSIALGTVPGERGSPGLSPATAPGMEQREEPNGEKINVSR